MPRICSAPRMATAALSALLGLFSLFAAPAARAQVAVSGDFFHLGGHSLRAAQVISRLNATLKTSLSVRHLFEHSTITSLASAIERLTPARPAVPALAQN